jgi:hypothetical protein
MLSLPEDGSKADFRNVGLFLKNLDDGQSPKKRDGVGTAVTF